jgi:phenylpropionate dioxygenase-like ring-hydroxylating dioxygenase large terminal subunit
MRKPVCLLGTYSDNQTPNAGDIDGESLEVPWRSQPIGAEMSLIYQSFPADESEQTSPGAQFTPSDEDEQALTMVSFESDDIWAGTKSANVVSWPSA